jgi:hypothetical protein
MLYKVVFRDRTLPKIENLEHFLEKMLFFLFLRLFDLFIFSRHMLYNEINQNQRISKDTLCENIERELWVFS